MPTELQRLTALARAAIDNEHGSANAAYSDDTRAFIRRLADALARQASSRAVAEEAVTRWMLTRRPVGECLAAEEETADQLPELIERRKRSRQYFGTQVSPREESIRRAAGFNAPNLGE